MKDAADTRRARVSRATKETSITLDLNVDGTGTAKVATGIGFFDHMLEALAKHAAFDLVLEAEGDLHVDHHHTMEDVGIVLGQAFKKSLGDFKGIRRFGHAFVPMDEAMARCAVDLSNRPYLVWRVELPRPTVGGVDTQLFKEWFHAFAMNAGACVHVETLYGENTHHLVEASFKALARALRSAAEPDDRLTGAPSTKGVL